MALIADLVTDIILARDIGGFISSIANNCAPLYEWEYYLDYLDPVFVDESQLKYHKYSIVIILWVSLAAFVGFLFLILNLMSLSVKLPKCFDGCTVHSCVHHLFLLAADSGSTHAPLCARGEKKGKSTPTSPLTLSQKKITSH
uniref:Melanocortin 2 receptor accessory protein n=1 Tax=Xiphophorus maculatus TaxID=8083 RepID=M3ZYI1_XIPMA